MNIFNRILNFFRTKEEAIDLESLCGDPEKCGVIPAMPYNDKKKVAQAIFDELMGVSVNVMAYTHGDFMLQSLVGLRLAEEFYEGKGDIALLIQRMSAVMPYGGGLLCPHAGWISEKPTTTGELPLWMPASYIGGNMVYGRIFRINLTALWDPVKKGKHYIGVRSDGGICTCRLLKGLKTCAINDKEWAVFQVDSDNTDDCTAMIYTQQEKEFDTEICVYRPGGEHTVILRCTCF